MKSRLSKSPQHASQILQEVFDQSLSMMVFVRGPEFVFEVANKRYLDFMGQPDLIGKRVVDAIPDFEALGLLAVIKEVYETQKPFIGNEVLINIPRPNGEVYHGYFNFVYQPLRDENGKCIGVFGQGQDVTEYVQIRKRAEEREIRLLDQMFSDSQAFMSLVVGPHHIYQRANKRFYELTGFDNSIIGKPIHEVMPEYQVQNFLDLLNKVYRTGEAISAQEVLFEIKASDGKIIKHYADFSYQAIRNAKGEIFGILAQGYPVTEKVNARKAIEAAKLAVDNERENFRNLFKQTPEMVCILKGPEHLFEFVNEAHVRVLGFDATGKTVRQAQPESVEVHGILDNVYQTGKTAELHEIPVTVGDRLRFFNLTYAARRDDDGIINGVMILGTEVTSEVENRERLRISQERLLLATSSAEVGIWEWDLLTNALATTDILRKILEFPEGKSLTSDDTFNKILTDDLVNIRSKLENAIRNKKDFEIEFRIRKLNGQVAWIYGRGSAVYNSDGQAIKVVGINIDITDRKEIEQELKRAKDEAEKANQLKSAFLANMSHEIRTPLGAMLGFADLLRDPSLSSSERLNFIDILARNGENLSVIINDILDLSKVESGHLSLEYTDVSPEQIAAEVMSLLGVKAKEKNLGLEYIQEQSTPPSIVSDPTRMRQILINIVSNAIKFTQFGFVKVRSFGCQTESGKNAVCFEVKDTGIGIPSSQKDNVFEMFVQADGSMTRRFGGTGLGLSLSRRLARSLGGDVSVIETDVGKGSTFLITIEDQPTRRNSESTIASEEKKRASEIQPNALNGVTVLVVDDAPDNQHLIWRYLSKYGAVVESAENGLIGYRKALNGQFDIVLMDIQMPEMDGYTATHKLRSAGYTKPIIALTAHAMSEARQKCLNVGCSGYIPKPINPRELVLAILEHIS